MQGAGSGPMRGIIPRAMEQVAAYCAQQRTRGWAYAMEVTYVEIYNEQVRDLLGEDAGAPTTRDFGRAEAQSGLEVFCGVSAPSSRPSLCLLDPVVARCLRDNAIDARPSLCLLGGARAPLAAAVPSSRDV